MTRARHQDLPLLDVCIAAAKSAGDYAIQHKPRRIEVHERFTHDVKLQLDHECQAQASAEIYSAFPGATILGEEGSKQGLADGMEWIIDPIDGTVNFFHGLPWWCSSVAVRLGGVVTAGAVYAPEVSMLFEAYLDQPARLNGKTIHVSEIDQLSDALVVTGSEKELNPSRPPLATAQFLAPHVQKIRILGAAALDMCQVASGAVDVFYQVGLYIWDVAAAGLIVQSAGGKYAQWETGISGRYGCLACANEKLRTEMEKFTS